MHAKPINEILAENLAYFMSELGLKQTAMGEKSGMGQTTVSLYLHPSRRKPSKSGKMPSISSLSAAARQLFSFKHNR